MRNALMRTGFAAGLAGAMGLWSGAAAALGNGLVVTPGLVVGEGSHAGSVHTIGSNPSGVAASPRVGVQFGLGSVGGGYEVGKVDNLMDEVDALEKDLNKDNLTLTEAEDIINDAERVLERLGKDGWGKLTFHGRPPTMPLIAGSARSGWSVGIDVEAMAHAGFSVLDDDIRFVPATQSLQSRTSAYGKGGMLARASILPSLRIGEWNDRALFFGARLNQYEAELSKTVIALEEDTEFDESLEDDLRDKTRRTSATGLDLGLTYKASIFTGGVTWLNVNEPSFDYPTIGTDCDAYTDTDLQNNCYTAASFGDRIDLRETWTLNEQMRVEGALHTPGERLRLAFSRELNSVRDMSGDEYQWQTVSAAFRLPWYLGWVPDLRAGYRENLTGTELSYTSVGLTWLGIISLDAAMANETVEIDGDEAPRSGMVNLGLQMRF